MAYSMDIRDEARHMYVFEGLSLEEISAQLGGRPSPATLGRWAREADEEGHTWHDLREIEMERRYESTGPDAIARRIFEKIEVLLAEPGFDARRADQLAKLSKYMREFVDPRHHMSMAYQVLREYVAYLHEYQPDLLTTDLVGSIRDFKNHKRKELGLP